MRFVARELTENVNISPGGEGKSFIRGILILCAVFFAVYFALIVMVDALISYVPEKVDRALAGIFSPYIQTPSEWETDRQRIEGVLSSMLERYDGPVYDFRVDILDHDEMNALAFPGGNIVLTSKLVESLESENELAMILGHELSHYRQHDHLRGLGRMIVFMGLMTVWSAGTNSNPLGQYVVNSIGTFDLKYSRKQERLADEYGLKFLVTRYQHAGGAVCVFEKLQEEYAAQEKIPFLQFFSSHPLIGERIRHLNELIGSRGYEVRQQLPLTFDLPERSELPPS
ncbi:MAG TPA: M48 family metallopeptidase [Candidatus Omnitrophota bacterium]|nr:M48 family metallopeptidase [Candidatus Omnitrophota bacterium]HSA30813.1 M48 family metallopeptidase [Candidatus Omnitrophota bacterium]